MKERGLAFWCAHHEAIVSPEHFFRCEITRPPPPRIHFHQPPIACMKAAMRDQAHIIEGECNG